VECRFEELQRTHTALKRRHEEALEEALEEASKGTTTAKASHNRKKTEMESWRGVDASLGVQTRVATVLDALSSSLCEIHSSILEVAEEWMEEATKKGSEARAFRGGSLY